MHRGIKTYYSTVYKAEKFEKIARTFPIKHSFFTSEHRFERAGEDGVDYLLQTKDRPTAIICAYDNIALGAIRQLRRRGYRVPEDISLISIDDVALSQLIFPGLTTMNVDRDKMIREGLQMLGKLLQGQKCESRRLPTPELILRQTTCLPKK